MNTSELIGLPLDWAVAKAEGKDFFIENGAILAFLQGADIPGVPYYDREYWMPSTNWSQGDPIIEEYGIAVGPSFAGVSSWVADMSLQPTHIRNETRSSGPTRLVAAMRCYVSFKLGDDIEIPEGLCP